MKTTQLKMGKGFKQTFLQRRHTNGKCIYNKDRNITNHQKMQINTAVKSHLTAVRMVL
jgi:hypothetical protein